MSTNFSDALVYYDVKHDREHVYAIIGSFKTAVEEVLENELVVRGPACGGYEKRYDALYRKTAGKKKQRDWARVTQLDVFHPIHTQTHNQQYIAWIWEAEPPPREEVCLAFLESAYSPVSSRMCSLNISMDRSSRLGVRISLPNRAVVEDGSEGCRAFLHVVQAMVLLFPLRALGLDVCYLLPAWHLQHRLPQVDVCVRLEGTYTNYPDGYSPTVLGWWLELW
ncbi:MAG: hypothetical protein AAF809_15800 [Bacteroidota bacterium]